MIYLLMFHLIHLPADTIKTTAKKKKTSKKADFVDKTVLCENAERVLKQGLSVPSRATEHMALLHNKSRFIAI